MSLSEFRHKNVENQQKRLKCYKNLYNYGLVNKNIAFW